MIAHGNLFLISLSLSFYLSAVPFKSWQAERAYKKGMIEVSKGNLDEAKGQFEKAFRLYGDVVSVQPNDIEALYNMGKVAYELKEYTQAQTAFEKAAHSALASGGQKEQSFFNLGDAYAMDKQYQKALDSYTTVLTINSHNEHAKKRIEKIKKLLEQQKQQEQQNNQDKNQQKKQNQESSKNDSQQKNESSQSQSDKNSQQSSQKNQDSKDATNGSSTERPSKDGQDTSKNRDEDHKKEDHGQENQSAQENKETENKHEAGKHERSQNEGNTNANQGKQQEQKDAQKNDADKGKDHDKSPQAASSTKNAASEKPESQNNHGYTIPEKQLSDQEKRNLQIIEEADKEAYKAFFRAQGRAGEADGQKNW